MSRPGWQDRAVPHIVIWNPASFHLVALSFLRALSSFDSLRLSRRHIPLLEHSTSWTIYIPLLEQATHHSGSPFTGKLLLIWTHTQERLGDVVSDCLLWKSPLQRVRECQRVSPLCVPWRISTCITAFLLWYFSVQKHLQPLILPACNMLQVVIYCCLCHLAKVIIQSFLITWSGGRWIVL